MTSTISNYSALIDTAFPIPGVDNDTQGFRNNFININKSFDVASSEITGLQTSQKDVLSRLNEATIVGDSFAAVIASTVTTIVINSLTNKSPDIVTPTVQDWYENTITNEISDLQSQITGNNNTLQTQITTNTNNIVTLTSATDIALSTATTAWNIAVAVASDFDSITATVTSLEGQVVAIETTATEAWDMAISVGDTVADNVIAIADLQSTSTTLWSSMYVGAGSVIQSINTLTTKSNTLDARSVNTGTWIGQVQASVNGILSTYATVTNTATSAWNSINGVGGLNTAVAGLQSFITTATTWAVGAPGTSKGQAGDRPGMIYANSNYIYICYGYYTGADIWARVASSSTWTA